MTEYENAKQAEALASGWACIVFLICCICAVVDCFDAVACICEHDYIVAKGQAALAGLFLALAIFFYPFRKINVWVKVI